VPASGYVWSVGRVGPPITGAEVPALVGLFLTSISMPVFFPLVVRR